MDYNESMYKKLIGAIFTVGILLASVGAHIVYAKDVASGRRLNANPPGAAYEVKGTHIEITGNDYLDLIIDSSKDIDLSVTSVPEIVLMEIAPNNKTKGNNTRLTISGFAPDSVYYRYEDNYHNITEFKTDGSGRYSYNQAVDDRHLIIIKPRKSTKYISTNNGGDCNSIGVWTAGNNTCTLNQDVTEAIEIDSSGITLDGGGYTVNAGLSGTGVYAYQKSGITIKNIHFNQSAFGVVFYYTSGSYITDNTFGNGAYGIYLISGSGNTVVRNTASDNQYYGIVINSSNNNTIGGSLSDKNYFDDNGEEGVRVSGGSNGNTISWNDIKDNGYLDLEISASSGVGDCSNTISDNTGSGDRQIGYYNSDTTLSSGTFSELILCNADYSYFSNITVSGSDSLDNNRISLDWTDNVTFSDVVSSNNNTGIFLNNSSGNTFSGITAESNPYYGIGLYYSSDNTIEYSNLDQNGYYNLFIEGSYNDSNEIHNNTISNADDVGLYIGQNSTNNYFYNNNIIDNYQQSVFGVGNVFNLASPAGGNYWSNYDTSGEGCDDVDSDGFCDDPYETYSDNPSLSGYDNLPFVDQNGWLTHSPVVSSINQYKSDGELVINEGGKTAEETTVFKGVITSPDNNQVKSQIELRPLSEGFTGQPTHDGSLVLSGNTASITVFGLSDGQYHWRYRAVDSEGNTSRWWSFEDSALLPDFVIKQVPLYKQIGESGWSSLYYADQSAVGSCGRYISDCGCAISSLVMIARYHDIDAGEDSEAVDPGGINDWFESNSGYTSDGGVKWTAMDKYTEGRLIYDNMITGVDRMSILNGELDDYGPVILEVHPGQQHFLVADTRLANNYHVRDPYFFETEYLNDQSGTNKYDYNNQTSRLVTYRVGQQGVIPQSLYINFASSSGEILIVDPNGYRLGYDPETSTSYNEISGGIYFNESRIGGDGEADKAIFIPNRVSGNYTISISSSESESYALDVLTYDEDGDTHAWQRTGSLESEIAYEYYLSQNLAFNP